MLAVVAAVAVVNAAVAAAAVVIAIVYDRSSLSSAPIVRRDLCPRKPFLPAYSAPSLAASLCLPSSRSPFLLLPLSPHSSSSFRHNLNAYLI